jgi:hypothetical protein
VKRKAIIGRLLRMRLLEEAPPGTDGRIRYRLVQQDMEKLRFSIYTGEGPDDHFFERNYQDGLMLQVLIKAIIDLKTKATVTEQTLARRRPKPDILKL